MKTRIQLLPLLMYAIVISALLGADSAASVRKRLEIPFSATAKYAGSVTGALYVIDSQKIRQYDRTSRNRFTIEMVDSKSYWFSPSGYHYLIAGLSPSEMDTAVSETQSQSDNEGGNSGYVLYNVLGRKLHSGLSVPGVKFYLSSTGRYLIANSAVGSGVEITIFDSLGTQIGLCHVAACDTVVFAPNERGFLVDAKSRGLFHFFFSGEKVSSFPAAVRYGFSLTGRRVVTYGNGQVSIYENEKLLSTHKISRPSVKKLIYEDSRGRLFVLTKTRLFKINTVTDVTAMEYATIGEGRTFEDVVYSAKSDMLALAISVSRGSTVSKDKQSAGYALRVITSDGVELPFYYVLTNKVRVGFPRVQLKASGRGALFLAPDQAHNIDW